MSYPHYTQHGTNRFRQAVNREVALFLQRIESLDFGDEGDDLGKLADHDGPDISQQYDDYVEKKHLIEQRKKLTRAKKCELEDKLEQLDHRLAYAARKTQDLLRELDVKRRGPNGADANEALARYRAHETHRYNLSVERDKVNSELGLLHKHVKGG
ncbi:Ff.00g100010.m01.CDS01 [Fusarium sp. VM40]|nr:Ff.00g100010.m01.CDS01 [Fusarium sp. VM40]